ncbi:MAB_1171c family putative transporter [Streptomyces sp. NPDC056492]|uniref:MAB_1171c family putative transporter n=1 Tax=unclassified Streptomyces TaxID=2593676 RepID=UPI003681D073
MDVTVLSLVLGAVLCLTLVWKISQLVKAPSDKLLHAVTLCIVCASLSFPLGTKGGARWLDALIGTGAAKLLQNVFLLIALYCLSWFFLQSAADRGTGSRRARRELIPLGVTIVVITLAMVATPRGERGHVYATANMQLTGVFVFYLAAGLYLVYALTMSLWWTVRHLRSATRPLATGLRIVAVALAGMAVAGSVRAALNVVRRLGSEVPSPVLMGAKLVLDLAIPLFVLGLIYPPMTVRWASARLWYHRYRTYHRLTPLWAALHQAFPEDSLGKAPTGTWRDALRLTGVHRRCYRRVIECRDGLVRVSPYIAQLAAQQEPLAEVGLDVAARHLRAALSAYAAGDPAPSQAVPVVLPGSDDFEDDLRQLTALSDALKAAPRTLEHNRS